MEAHQRERIFNALGAVIAERSYADFTIRQVVRAAAVSSKTFYELFDDKRELVANAYDAIFARLLERIAAACAAEGDWVVKLAAAVAAAVDYATSEPQLVSLLDIQGFAATDAGRDRAHESRERLAALLSAGREDLHGHELPPITEPALVGAIWSIVADCLDRGDVVRLAELEPDLIELALAPYAGRGCRP